jgi:hypothetical protein
VAATFTERDGNLSVTYVGGQAGRKMSLSEKLKEWTLEHSDAVVVVMAVGGLLGFVAMTWALV